jgi:hypothetical protein
VARFPSVVGGRMCGPRHGGSVGRWRRGPDGSPARGVATWLGKSKFYGLVSGWHNVCAMSS